MISDQKIQALVDNVLSADEEKAALRIIKRNPCLLKKYEHYLEQKEQLKQWWTIKQAQKEK